MGVLHRAVENTETAWISAALRANPAQLSRARLMFWMCLVAGGACVGVIILTFFDRPDPLWANVLVLVGHLMVCGSAISLRYAKTIKGPSALFTIIGGIHLTSATVLTGGFTSPVIYIFPVFIFFVGHLSGFKAALWSCLFLGLATGIIWKTPLSEYPKAFETTSTDVSYFLLLWGIGTAAAIAWLHDRETMRYQERIEADIDALRLATDKLERLSSDKDRFLAYLSHELRTPLTAILGAAELLDRSDTDARQARFIGSLHDAATGMAQMLDDLLDLSRAGAGHLNLTITPFEIDELLDELDSECAPLMEKRGIHWRIARHPSAAECALADPVRLKQVLRNLLNNAMKFTSKGEVNLTITSGGTDEVCFTVKDTGRGIAPEDIDIILEPYRQAREVPQGGTGLGLSICRHLLALMDAELKIESTVGEGSTFSFTLSAAPSQAGDATPPSATSLDGMHVVVAEDNEAAGVVIEGLLSSLGCEVTRASNGLEAIEMVTSRQPKVALLDIQMPQMSGLEAAKALRAQMREGQLKPCQLVALTGNLGAEDDLRNEAAFDAVLLKPVQRDELLSCLQKHTTT